MPKFRLVIALTTIVAMAIIALAVYFAASYSTLNIKQGIVLIALSVIVLFLSLGIILIFIRNIMTKK